MRVLCVLFVALGMTLTAASQSQKQPAANKQSSQEQVQKPATNQTVPDVRQQKPEAVVTQTRPVESQVHADAHKEQDRAQTVKEINDTLLVIFTGMLAVVGYLQWSALRKHETWMKANVGIAKESADAARDSADAANATVKTMKDISQGRFSSYHEGNDAD